MRWSLFLNFIKHVLCESEWGLFIYSMEVAIAL